MAFASSAPQLLCPGPAPHQKVCWPHTLINPFHFLQLSHTATPAVSLQCHKDIVFFPLLFSSVAQSCPTLRGQASLSITNSCSLFKLISIELEMPSHLLLYPCILKEVALFLNIYLPIYGTPLQYSCLESPMDGGAWWAAVHGVATSQTQLSNFTFTFHFHALEKEMATYSSILAWRIPGTGEPGGLPSMGWHRVGHD